VCEHISKDYPVSAAESRALQPSPQMRCLNRPRCLSAWLHPCGLQPVPSAGTIMSADHSRIIWAGTRQAMLCISSRFMWQTRAVFRLHPCKTSRLFTISLVAIHSRVYGLLPSLLRSECTGSGIQPLLVNWNTCPQPKSHHTAALTPHTTLSYAMGLLPHTSY